MSDNHPEPPPPNRRRFLQWCTHGLGALWAALFAVPIVAYLVDARNRAARDRGFKTVARLSALKSNEPQQAVIHDLRRDAWTLHPNDVVGRVWLIRRDGNEVEAFTTICPHLGCSINYDETSNRFICPCHMGTWYGPGTSNVAAGELVPSSELGRENAPPRNMDALKVHVDPNADIVEVKYETFQKGVHEQKPIA